MVKRKLAALEKVDIDLPNLQHKIKRDPPSYVADFRSQYQQYENQREIFMAAPTSTAASGVASMRELIDFISHVSDRYSEVTKNFPQELIELFTLHHNELEPELREKVVGSLTLLRKKAIIDSTTLLQHFFPILVSTPSKTLRALLLQRIVNELKTANSKSTNHKLNRTIQQVLQNLVISDRGSSEALWAVKITREMWKRQIWTDTRTVVVMEEAALADNEKVVCGGVRFFLGGDKEREEMEEESSDNEGMDIAKLRHTVGVNKKNKKANNALKQAAAKVKRKEKRKGQPQALNFSALHLLRDPQGFAETLFSKHLQNTKSKLNLEQKLLVLQLVSRLIGLHKLTIIHFYSYFFKYLNPRQPSVTSFLASLAQSTHSLVPPDLLEPLVQKIANEFVSEASAGEVAASGLNAIREICVRQPLAMSDVLLQDLVMYKKSKDKGVMMAAKGLLGLYRQVGAEMLKKRDRGKDTTLKLRSGEQKQVRYGEEELGEIKGLELLEKWKEDERLKNRKMRGKGLHLGDSDDQEETEEEGWNAWEVKEDEDSDSIGWINVESDDEIEISDEEDEEPSARKKVKFDIEPNNDGKDGMNDIDRAAPPKSSNLATTRILTPADLAKLQQLRATTSVTSAMGKSHESHHATAGASLTKSQQHMDDELTAAEIEGLASLSKGKTTRAQRLALLQEDKAEREKHKSKAARKKERKEIEGKSSTNKDKARKKNFMMTLGKAKKKSKMSLVDHGKILKLHKQRGKSGGRRGNTQR